MTNHRALKYPSDIDLESIKTLIEELIASIEDAPAFGVYAERDAPGDKMLTLFAEQIDGDLVIGTEHTIDHLERLASWLRDVVAESRPPWNNRR